MESALSLRMFGTATDGSTIEAWTLRSASGLVLEIITYGATVTRLLAPDRDGLLADVVLGFDNLAAYYSHPAYFGSVVGRVAGRVSNARFRLDGELYKLAPNDAPNHLHGGEKGFDKKIWEATPLEKNGDPALRLTYRSPHLEEGYPGTVNVAVTYTVAHDNTLIVETQGATDRPTPFNLTLHHYFNLGGEGQRSVADHELQIHADEFIATDESMTLLGKVSPVEGTQNDFRCPKRLGEAIPSLFRNHGDLYVLRRTNSDGEKTVPCIPAARLVHSPSGRILEISTTATHLQLYTAAALDGSLKGKSGAAYPQYGGVCLECEGYPDGVNQPLLGDIILRPGNPKKEITKYAFSCV